MSPIKYLNFVKQSKFTHSLLSELETQISALEIAGTIQELTPSQIAKAKIIAQTASKKYTEFETNLQNLLTTDPLPEDIDDSEVAEFQQKISDLSIKINTSSAVLLPNINEERNSSNSSIASSSRLETSNIRLPPLSLGNFSGQPEKWIQFHNLFESSVHNNPSLSEVEKFTYLISCLSNEPLNLIKNLPVSNENYQIAWEQLTERYNNSRLLISIHVNNILDLPTMQNSSVKQLRNFITSFQENANALKTLGHDIQTDSLFLAFHLLRKFDHDIRSKFEHSRSDSKNVPSINEFIKFIETECVQLEAANLTQTSSKSLSSSFKGKQTQSHSYVSNTNPNKPAALITSSNHYNCVFCDSSEHSIYKCEKFSHILPEQRLKFIQSNSMCNNCLGHHSFKNCRSNRSCQVCKRKHHTLLHLGPSNVPSNMNPVSKINLKDSQKSNQNILTQSCSSQSSTQQSTPLVNQSKQESKSSTEAFVGISNSNSNVVLLGTALIQLTSSNGKNAVVRAVLDSAAQQTFITESCARKLGISYSHTSNHQILGISSTAVSTKGDCLVNITSLSGQVVANNHFVTVLDKITNHLPSCEVSSEVKMRMQNLMLADPTFDKPAPIDALIGADLFALTLRGNTIHLGINMPTALETMFGYVLLGNAPTKKIYNEMSPTNSLLTISNVDLHNAIQRFWTTENLPETSTLSPSEEFCEKHFLNTHSRLKDGRYQVRLPMKTDPTALGDSSRSALKTFQSIEHRLKSNPEEKEKYVEFMEDYEQSGHMTPYSLATSAEKPHCFLPHHPVMREGKIRVVFNASSVTSSGSSLNSILHAGPKLHNDIPSIILKFRRHQFVFTCDIKQMFRNIWLHPEDRTLQLIYWRNNPSEAIKIFQLNTVTYGMRPSPFLANRVVQQLISEESSNHPLAAAGLKDQIYVDDALLGSDTLEECLLLQKDTIQLMEQGGFSLRKWSSNVQEVLDAVPEEHRRSQLLFDDDTQPLCKILGLSWLPDKDVFSYSVKIPTGPLTKRSVLSTIACLYDPMGWLSPIVFWSKSFMQLLWSKGLQWDDLLPLDLQHKWTQYLQELPIIEKLSIPRFVNTTSSSKVQLHGFCDASNLGYCSAVYLRVLQPDNTAIVHLLIAKSRVSPLKSLSLPRLELCGAHMLSKLLDYTVKQLSTFYTIEEIFAWCDSTIVINWIKTPAYRLKTFVANRIAEIQDFSIPISWSHIESTQNPADCGSRGFFPSQLIEFDLWWNGPTWLSASESEWPKPVVSSLPLESIPEMKPEKIDALVTTKPEPSEILLKYSSWNKLLHVVAFILRFSNNCKRKNTQELSETKSTSLTSADLNQATNHILHLVQQESFADDIAALKSGKLPSNNIQRLSPFLDDEGLIRLGGRLKNASINYSAKHPVLLPKSHHVTQLIVDYYHISYLHCGAQQLQSLLNQKYWILSARSVIRTRIFHCIRCFKCKPKLTTPCMGDLPKCRVSPSRPFQNTAVDFAGPLNIKLHNRRKLQPEKIYICLFICMSTKAVHLEVVMDLTSEAFIGALERFISRRGLISHLYCDNATNFVGASRLLYKNFQQLIEEDPTQKFLADHLINFCFIPPRGPHFGGLWERAVQSVKTHLRRTIGDQILTLEEFMTLLCKVEAILNSRPLTPLSNDPDEYEALTPGHFLSGGSLVTLPTQNLTDVPQNRLKRWQLVQSFAQHIWQRWYKEYLHTLQQKPKWIKPKENLKINDLVLIHEDNLPPLQWKLGRIVKTFPGQDKIVRVAEIKTKSGHLTRPVTKLSLLPVE